MRALLLILALASPQFIFVVPPYVTRTADSCSSAHVQAAINASANGDRVNIPAGSCTWTSGIVVPDGVSVKGTGTPNTSVGDVGADASCSDTEITINGVTALTMSPDYGDATMRVSCMELVYGGSSNSVGFKILGTCTSSGCPSIRIDNLTLTGWTGHASNGLSYGIAAVGDVFGVVDHNTVAGTGSTYLQFLQIHHGSYVGVGDYGDSAWAEPDDFGTEKFLFIENNTFTASGCCENEGSPGAYEDEGGTRWVVRYNTFTDMDAANFAMGSHGTDSGGRYRGPRAYEFYGNTWTAASGASYGQVAGTRSGTGVVWGNTFTHANPLGHFFTLSSLRALQNAGGAWGPCDGSSPWDTNDGMTYWSGTVGSVSKSGEQYVITASGGSPGWSANQWVSAGSPYSLHDATSTEGSEITASGSNTITIQLWSVANLQDATAFNAGHSVAILRSSVCLDQPGRGEGTYYSGGTPSPSSAANQTSLPTYFWLNTNVGSAPSNGVEGVTANTSRWIRNREWYSETLSQTAQSSASSPFDGTTTIGVGHGVVANRPTTCTTGVAYWATDQSVLYRCTSTNTWTSAYAPYTYPHHLVTS